MKSYRMVLTTGAACLAMALSSRSSAETIRDDAACNGGESAVDYNALVVKALGSLDYGIDLNALLLEEPFKTALENDLGVDLSLSLRLSTTGYTGRH